jgi:hypothetical protein
MLTRVALTTGDPWTKESTFELRLLEHCKYPGSKLTNIFAGHCMEHFRGMLHENLTPDGAGLVGRPPLVRGFDASGRSGPLH